MIEKFSKKYLTVPSTFTVANRIFQQNFIDLNALYWEYIFSEDQLNKVYSENMNNKKYSDEIKKYMKFIIQNIKIIKKITQESFLFPYEEKRILYCFNIYIFILSILNSEFPDYNFTIAYGAHLKEGIACFEKYISEETNFFSTFYNHVLENEFFIENCTYIISMKWENDIFHVLALSYLLKKKFKQINVFIDLGTANEQTDFSFWQNDRLIKKYVDGFLNIYRDKGDDFNGINNNNGYSLKEENIYGIKKVSTRLFNTGCYWRKCTFCTINSKYKDLKSYEKLTKEGKFIVHQLVNSLKKYKDNFLLVLADEAIEASILIYFAKQVIKSGLKMFWNARARFSPLYTNKNCKILAESGLRFLGFGLESVNQRVIGLMNKREKEYSIHELNEIIYNCDSNGINVHAYFIMGFPSETKVETRETIDFIEYNLKKRNFFTFSANVFYLMKGSTIFKNPSKFGIKITDKNVEHKLGAINFTDNSKGDKFTREELFNLSKQLYAKIFFKNPNTKYLVQLGYLYWDFLDRLNLFYDQKLLNKFNPYLRENSKMKLNEDTRNSVYNLLPMPYFRKNQVSYLDVVNQREIKITQEVRKVFYYFVTNYDQTKTLGLNMAQVIDFFKVKNGKKEEKLNFYVKKLLESAILYRHKTKEDIK